MWLVLVLMLAGRSSRWSWTTRVVVASAASVGSVTAMMSERFGLDSRRRLPACGEYEIN